MQPTTSSVVLWLKWKLQPIDCLFGIGSSAWTSSSVKQCYVVQSAHSVQSQRTVIAQGYSQSSQTKHMCTAARAHPSHSLRTHGHSTQSQRRHRAPHTALQSHTARSQSTYTHSAHSTARTAHIHSTHPQHTSTAHIHSTHPQHTPTAHIQSTHPHRCHTCMHHACEIVLNTRTAQSHRATSTHPHIHTSTHPHIHTSTHPHIHTSTTTPHLHRERLRVEQYQPAGGVGAAIVSERACQHDALARHRDHL